MSPILNSIPGAGRHMEGVGRHVWSERVSVRTLNWGEPFLNHSISQNASWGSPTAQFLCHLGQVNCSQIQLASCQGWMWSQAELNSPWSSSLEDIHTWLLWTAFVHPVTDASLERFEAETQHCVCTVLFPVAGMQSHLNSAYKPLLLPRRLCHGPSRRQHESFFVCLTLSLQIGRRAWWRLQGVGCGKLVQD